MNAHTSLSKTAAASAARRDTLWNPDAAACWSLLFTPLFGAYLLIRNWEALGEPKRAVRACWWFALSLMFVILNFYYSLLCAEASPLRMSNVIFLLVWYIAEASPQERFIRERLGTDYARHSWAVALPCALVLLMAYVFGYVRMLALIMQVH
ncbi:hypothetical protein [Massilia antarctica]|uniref:hypothetical protein n=1 Tax=Massilia antarctica TaxID=2765360 RepID=UPI0006BB81F9|nr:hypothetical protein [Massilia sp. H27-R4]MCY0915518.1 hypothetical protein [Massilia sp. H27-R4]CUI04132.1 hypothetical protein BN2497_3041 [Janthinobacterium sp. CG23_2]CUU27918.1 hypothetical protein BN3177_3041 [Janthinobacterium sp. CG23_2]